MLTSIIVQVALQTSTGSCAGGSQVISLGTVNPTTPSFAYQLPAIAGLVSISSATLNAAAQSAFMAAGGSLT